MSWFTEIAGKAEDLLNRVDQTAATALQSKSKTPSLKSEDQYLKSSKNDTKYDPSYSSRSAYSSPQKTRNSNFGRASENKNLYSSNLSSPRKKPESDDEKLLRFLNSNEALMSEQNKSERRAKALKTVSKSTEPIELVDGVHRESEYKFACFFVFGFSIKVPV